MPPQILFTSEIFHPLVTPLTTYTYTTGSLATDTVSATDEERLPPGGFSLRQAFPQWYEKQADGVPGSPSFPTPTTGSLGVLGLPDSADGRLSFPPPQGGQGRSRSFHITPPKEDGPSLEKTYPTILEVLRYVKQAFEDPLLIDNLPLEAAGNPGAWQAWQAYRRKAKPVRHSPGESNTRRNTPRHTPQRSQDQTARLKQPGEWNWDGVWAERVKRGINLSLSESMLYGNSSGDEIVSQAITLF